jgi:hypothetical protein
MSTMEISRRAFLTGAAATVLAAGSADSPVRATSSEWEADITQSEVSRFDQPGNPSRLAYRKYAEEEYKHYQRMRERHEQQGNPSGGNSSGSGNGPGKPTAPNFSRTVDAVDEFGVDPTGNRPIGSDIDSLPEDSLVVFPAGNFKLKDHNIFDANKAGFVGSGYKEQKPPVSGKNTTTFVVPANTYARLDFRMSTGLVGNFVFDFTASKAMAILNARSSGFVYYRDIVWNGLVDTVGSAAQDSTNGDYLCAMQPEKSATSRATRFVMKNNGIPGTKDIGGRNGFWCGESNKGTAQIEHCVVSAVADNGVYGGRTPGDVQIKGGEWVNNEVSHNRFSGEGSFSDGATMIFDADNYEGPQGDYGKFNDKKGAMAVKIERGDNGISKPSGAILRNADIQLLSAGPHGLGGGIRIRGSGGAAKIENCRITNNVDTSSVIAEPPGGGYSGYKAPSPHNITITDSLFQGTNAESIVDVRKRTNSMVRKTCFKIAGASSNSINGMDIGNGVGFGKTCKSGGLKAPDKVGASGNLSAINISAMDSVNSSFGGNSQQRQQKRRKQNFLKRIVSGIFTMFLLVVLVVLGGIATLFYLIFGD